MSETQPGTSVLERLLALLRDRGASFSHTHHAPTFTSEEAAAVRGVTLCSGAKALILKADERFLMAVLPADLQLDGKAFRKGAGLRSVRFATMQEVLELTGLRPGSIPPFGSLFGLPTYCDPRLAENERINFNAGAHSDSVSMTPGSYLEIEKPSMLSLAKALKQGD